MKTKLKSSANPSMIKPREAGAKEIAPTSTKTTKSQLRTNQQPHKEQMKKMTRSLSEVTFHHTFVFRDLILLCVFSMIYLRRCGVFYFVFAAS